MKFWKEYFFSFLIYCVGFWLLLFCCAKSVLDSYALYAFLFFIVPPGISTFLTRKLDFSENDYSYTRFYNSFILTLGITGGSFYFYSFLQNYLFLVLGALLVSFTFELLWLKIYLSRRYPVKTKEIKGKRGEFSVKGLFLSLFLFSAPLLYQSSGLIRFDVADKKLFLFVGLFFLFYFSVRLTYNFSYKVFNGYWRFIWGFLKSYVLLAALIVFWFSIVRFDSKLFRVSVEAWAIYSILSFLFSTIYYYAKKQYSEFDSVLPALNKAPVLNFDVFEERLVKINDGKYSVNGAVFDKNVISNNLKNVYLKDFLYLYENIEAKLDLGSVDSNRVRILKSRDEYNVDILPDSSQHLFVNLHEINNFRRINQYFIKVNKKLADGGVFIAKTEPIMKRYDRFLNSYPNILAKSFYFIDFIWRRVMPKIPVFQKFYFLITDGKNRAISFAETLGRFYYCGFEVIDVFMHENFVYVTAVKKREPSSDKNPSYGPLFKMKRVGKDGKFIYVYKMRTMHPYSEYIQELVFRVIGSSTGDKVDKDFRVTSWGKFLRTLWIDELPMLINLYRGELKVVGVRPLSIHKFNLYPKYCRDYRIQFKPGLIPPFYSDLPKNFNELVESEMNYLRKYEKSPFITDVKYFFKAFYNILVKRARSG